jgi:4-hydroxybenzoate polyprenyltransferase
VSMTALQASIGALNDRVDAATDAGRKPGKPIPAGLVSAGAASVMVVGAAAIGVALAVPSGPWLVALAVVVLVIGYGYDLLAKGTAWSWLPFALGIPLLPLYGWLGASGSVPVWFAALLPMAMLAGAGLAVANTRVDMVRDAAAGSGSVALALGERGSWLANVVLLAGALALAVGWLVLVGQGSTPASLGMVAGTVILAAGLGLGRATDAARRERSWQLQAVGVAGIALGWVSALVAVPA